MVDVIGLLSSAGFVMFNKQFAKEFGIEAALMIGELCSEYKFFADRDQLMIDEDGELFPGSIANIEENTCLTRKKQDSAIAVLRDYGFIETFRKGLPAKRYFKICVENLAYFFDVGKTRVVKKDKHCCPQGTNPIIYNNNIYNNKNNIKNKNHCAPGVHFGQTEKNSEPIEEPIEEASVETVKEPTENEILDKNFEILYAAYPKKKGKTVARANYKAWLKGKSVNGHKIKLTNEQMYRAIRKYVSEMEASGKDYEYWKNFDTLMGRQLLDFIEDDKS